MIARVASILSGRQVRYAVIGGFALAARGYARFTEDFDFFTTDARTLSETFWSELDTPVDVRKGDSDDPLAGVVRIGRKPDQIDVVVGKWKWEGRVIERAELVDIQGVLMTVPVTSDLILLKLAAGGFQDRADVHHLLQLGPRQLLEEEVGERLQELSADIQSDARRIWEQIAAEPQS